MLEYFFERSHRVLMARISGVFGSPEAAELDRAVQNLVRGEQGLRAVYDFSDMEALAIPEQRIDQRAQRPSLIEGLRVVVASRTLGGDKARQFSTLQSNAGARAPIVVSRLEQAYVLLGLDQHAKFERLEPGL